MTERPKFYITTAISYPNGDTQDTISYQWANAPQFFNQGAQFRYSITCTGSGTDNAIIVFSDGSTRDCGPTPYNFAQILANSTPSSQQKSADSFTIMLTTPACPLVGQIKKEAESIGLDKVFVESGAEWRESGCSMCLGMNGDTVPSGQLSVSTSNRNFEGRQGIGARTILASPMTAAASAILARSTLAWARLSWSK